VDVLGIEAAGEEAGGDGGGEKGAHGIRGRAFEAGPYLSARYFIVNIYKKGPTSLSALRYEAEFVA
jgi:hypothetical protein